VLAFHSDHATAVVTPTATYCWRGQNAPPREVEALERLPMLRRNGTDPGTQRMRHGAEPREGDS